MKTLWTVVLYQPLINGLFFLYSVTGSLGWAIIALTVLIRLAMIPLTLPSMKSAQKMKDLAPELAKLKKKWAHDKEKLAKAQMDFYKEKGVNPASGCLPQIVQIIVLLAMFQAFRNGLNLEGAEAVAKINESLYSSLRLAENFSFDLKFWYLNLAKPDLLKVGSIPLPGLFLIGSAVFQFVSAKLMMPKAEKDIKIAQKTEEKSDDMMAAMQKQSLFIMPLSTLFIGYSFPSGLVLYWFVFSVFSTIQQVMLDRVRKNK
jgi:YidC/Oxa1 family membrane protein insertase